MFPWRLNGVRLTATQYHMQRPAGLGKRAARQGDALRHGNLSPRLIPPYQFCNRFTTALIPASDSPYQFRRMPVPPPIPAFGHWNHHGMNPTANAWDLGCMFPHTLTLTHIRKLTDGHIRTDTYGHTDTTCPFPPRLNPPTRFLRAAAQTKSLVLVADCVI